VDFIRYIFQSLKSDINCFVCHFPKKKKNFKFGMSNSIHFLSFVLLFICILIIHIMYVTETNFYSFIESIVFLVIWPRAIYFFLNFLVSAYNYFTFSLEVPLAMEFCSPSVFSASFAFNYLYTAFTLEFCETELKIGCYLDTLGIISHCFCFLTFFFLQQLPFFKKKSIILKYSLLKFVF
jgi:hypothetical protein